MNSFLLALTIATGAASLALIGVVPNEGVPALLLAAPLMVGAAFIVRRIKQDDTFLLRVFICAFAVRILVGTLIYFSHQQAFFGGDATTFDVFGAALLKTWEGDKDSQYLVDLFMGGGSSSGWGMMYLVAAIYKIVGR